MPAIRFDASICADRAESFRREWIETNGIGGFSSSTVAGVNTRRYHGLLMAAVKPPAVRVLLLSRLEETLIAGERRFELSTNCYPGVIHPEGYKYLTEFRLDPFPVSTFRVDGATVEKRVFMVEGENAAVVEYELIEGPECALELRPLIAFRGYHELTHANPALNGALKQSEGLCSIQPYPDRPELHFAHNAANAEECAVWYYRFEYPIERERGLDFQEDLYCPCLLSFDLSRHRSAVLIASTQPHRANESASLKANEIERRRTAAPSEDSFESALTGAAAQFVVRRGSLDTVIAGYPWFTDWGRDTMIALPGLTLATGRFEVARAILLAFADSADQGMLPNVFPDTSANPQYNSVDATLWFFEAVRQYLAYTNDAEFIRAKLYPKLTGIIDWHVHGTRYGIHMDSDGLLIAGDGDTQLTWMDARVDRQAVTPRNGKPVEVQALWYNALAVMAKLANDFKDEPTRGRMEDLAGRVSESFDSTFWDEERGCLYDVIDVQNRDNSLRPNQVIALSLGHCAIPGDHARRIIQAAEHHLLTPYGLRTLAPFEPGYRGRYTGSPAERDAAYHQGTVWPWLLGPFLTADARFNGDAARRRRSRLLDPLRTYALGRGTGQIPEIFDGDAPHEPRGCFAQAWSVAEVLRMLPPQD